jgi:hypothetical protein
MKNVLIFANSEWFFIICKESNQALLIEDYLLKVKNEKEENKKNYVLQEI